MFHHFHDDFKYPNLKGGGSISVIEFHSIVDYLEDNFNIITPDEYTHKVVSKSIEESDVCLTFDDNLKCQFDIIYPELEKRKLKAFFFIYSKVYSDNPPLLEFFRDFKLNFFKNIDDYYELFFEAIRVNNIEEHNALLNSYEADFLSNYPFYSINDKKYRFLRDMILKDKYFEVVLDIMKEYDYSFSSRKENLFISIEELKVLHNSGHSIGLHSHSHPTNLHHMSYKNQLEEYTKNYEFINSITGEKVTSMCHPSGKYNDDTHKILKKLEIKVGFRDSLLPSNMKSSLEVPREDHTNLIKKINQLKK